MGFSQRVELFIRFIPREWHLSHHFVFETFEFECYENFSDERRAVNTVDFKHRYLWKIIKALLFVLFF